MSIVEDMRLVGRLHTVWCIFGKYFRPRLRVGSVASRRGDLGAAVVVLDAHLAVSLRGSKRKFFGYELAIYTKRSP